MMTRDYLSCNFQVCTVILGFYLVQEQGVHLDGRWTLPHQASR